MTHSQIDIAFDTVVHASAGSIVYPPGGRFGPRVQQDIQLVMLYTGEIDVTIDGRFIHVSPGHLLLLKPGHEESFQFSKKEETWHRWIAVHVSCLSDETRHTLYQLPECIPLTEEINRLTDLMLIAQQHDAHHDDPAIRSLGLTALHLYPSESKRAHLQREKHPAIYKALSWIREHYAEDISLSDLAAYVGLSSEHLLRLFKQDVGVPPIQYLWNYRVDRSIELLTSTGLTILEIAHRCGFKTSHHFARLIKKTTGRTATEIRHLSWGGMRKA
ncbi:MAG: AraC family transcriptional regulator [Candidatus Cohnella colombiensis]|uniref:AraC family transcriptional regulator n=1 Tax=Candidatus Cohnella colombiensis TaxID=3121368 RepID=A0AA95JF90_9BACL|nr:MAG: AraC family transcriptional regulator [Cohnella sp.]